MCVGPNSGSSVSSVCPVPTFRPKQADIHVGKIYGEVENYPPGSEDDVKSIKQFVGNEDASCSNKRGSAQENS